MGVGTGEGGLDIGFWLELSQSRFDLMDCELGGRSCDGVAHVLLKLD